MFATNQTIVHLLLNFCRMRIIIVVTFFAFSTNFLHGQLLLGVNYNISKYSSNTSLIELTQTNSSTIGISSEWGQAIVAGADLYISTNNSLKHFEVFLKGGVVLNATSRVQFPLFVGLGYATLNDVNTHKYGDALFGIEGHLRFYFTDQIAINGGVKYAGLSVNKIDENEYDDSVGRIRQIKFSVGITKQL